MNCAHAQDRSGTRLLRVGDRRGVGQSWWDVPNQDQHRCMPRVHDHTQTSGHWIECERIEYLGPRHDEGFQLARKRGCEPTPHG